MNNFRYIVIKELKDTIENLQTSIKSRYFSELDEDNLDQVLGFEYARDTLILKFQYWEDNEILVEHQESFLQIQMKDYQVMKNCSIGFHTAPGVKFEGNQEDFDKGFLVFMFNISEKMIFDITRQYPKYTFGLFS